MNDDEMMSSNVVAVAMNNVLKQLTPTMVVIQNAISDTTKVYNRLENTITPTISILSETVNLLINQSIAKSIPNLRVIDSQYKQLNKTFCVAIEQLMRMLDFPVVQPVITEEQLEKRLEQMDDHEMASFDKNVEEIIKESPINEKEKIDLREIMRKAKTLAKKALAVIAAINAIISFVKHVHDFVDLANSKLQSTPNSANEVYDIQDDCIGSEHGIDASCISPPPIATPITSELDGED